LRQRVLRPQLKRDPLGRAGELMRHTIILLGLLLPPCAIHAQQSSPKGYMPPAGFVPDSATAVRVAVAVWIPIYGERQIMSEKPFVATLKDSVWTVTGSLPPAPKGHDVVGGTVVAKIAKRDGRILFVTHYR
jgi:hypothetical protein